MPNRLKMERKVGIFVSLGIGLTMFALLIMEDSRNLFFGKVYYSSYFQDVEGLISGAKVVLGGVAAGKVENIEFDSDRKNIKVLFSLPKKLGFWVRKGMSSKIGTQGVLGDKYIELKIGTMDQPILPVGSEIPIQAVYPLDHFIRHGNRLLEIIEQLLTKFHQMLQNFKDEPSYEILLQNLVQITHHLAHCTQHMDRHLAQAPLGSLVESLTQILEKVNSGNGTLGALLNDPMLYDQMKDLIGGANRSRIIRGLIRKTITDSKKDQSQIDGLDSK